MNEYGGMDIWGEFVVQGGDRTEGFLKRCCHLGTPVPLVAQGLLNGKREGLEQGRAEIIALCLERIWRGRAGKMIRAQVVALWCRVRR